LLIKKSKFAEEQIGFALRQGDLGTPLAEVCRKPGISEATYFRWSRNAAAFVHPSCVACGAEP
jgi:hypothetical protein